jgi:5-(carboxyamino)imidazole ribonucleotide mutase
MRKVGIILGSKSDLEIAKNTIKTLKNFEIDYDLIISSAHRSPERTLNWVKQAESNNISVIIAIAGAAAHLAGFVAAHTIIPVIGVPVASTSLCGFDALLSTLQMPGGIPVATMAIGPAGATNAAVLAIQILSTSEIELKKKLLKYKKELSNKVESDHETALKEL